MIGNAGEPGAIEREVESPLSRLALGRQDVRAVKAAPDRATVPAYRANIGWPMGREISLIGTR